jgi:hypothetical protein
MRGLLWLSEKMRGDVKELFLVKSEKLRVNEE